MKVFVEKYCFLKYYKQIWLYLRWAIFNNLCQLLLVIGYILYARFLIRHMRIYFDLNVFNIKKEYWL